MKPRLKLIITIFAAVLALAAAHFIFSAYRAAASRAALEDNAPADPRVEIKSGLAGTREGKEAGVPLKMKAKAPVVIKIADAKYPIDLLTITDILLNIAQMILLAMLIGWAVSFVRKKIRDFSRITPYEAARGKISAVRASAAKKKISPPEFCSVVPEILKSYVKDEFQIGSSESTTTEFLKGFNDIAAADEPRRLMCEILSLCDLVKFSGHSLSPEELEKCIGNAESILASLNEQKEA